MAFFEKKFWSLKILFFLTKKIFRVQRSIATPNLAFKVNFFDPFLASFWLKMNCNAKTKRLHSRVFFKKFGNDSETYIFLRKKFSCHYIQQKKRCEQPKFTHYFTIFSPFGTQICNTQNFQNRSSVFLFQMVKKW